MAKVGQLKIRLYSLKQKTRSKTTWICPSKDMATCSKIPWFPTANLWWNICQISGAQAQYIAVQAELDEAKKRPGSSNKQWLVAKGKSYWRIAGSRNRRPGAISLPRTWV
jgi:hypothetical protein